MSELLELLTGEGVGFVTGEDVYLIIFDNFIGDSGLVIGDFANRLCFGYRLDIGKVFPNLCGLIVLYRFFRYIKRDRFIDIIKH